MKGRLENEIKIERNITTTLSKMPYYASEWYINLKASKREPSSCNDFINKLKRFLQFINNDIMCIKPEDITLSET